MQKNQRRHSELSLFDWPLCDDPNDPDDRELELEVRQPEELLPDIETQNIIVLSLLLVLGESTIFTHFFRKEEMYFKIKDINFTLGDSNLLNESKPME